MDCIFCGISRGKINSERIFENENFFSIFDANPKIEGHCLIISKKHFENSLDLPATLGTEFLDCIKNTFLKITIGKNFSGFNILQNNFESAGQVVKHFHIHLLPRKKDDGLQIFG